MPGRWSPRRSRLQARFPQVPLDRSRTRQLGMLVLKFEPNHLRTPTGMIATQPTECVHDFRIGCTGTATAALLIVGRDGIGPLLLKAREQALHCP